jgi:hypothetical protein
MSDNIETCSNLVKLTCGTGEIKKVQHLPVPATLFTRTSTLPVLFNEAKG